MSAQVYPSNWPVVAAMYKQAHAINKRAGRAEAAASYADRFDAGRRVCMGVRCALPVCVD